MSMSENMATQAANVNQPDKYEINILLQHKSGVAQFCRDFVRAVWKEAHLVPAAAEP
jgi:hypothetical protein